MQRALIALCLILLIALGGGALVWFIRPQITVGDHWGGRTLSFGSRPAVDVTELQTALDSNEFRGRLQAAIAIRHPQIARRLSDRRVSFRAWMDSGELLVDFNVPLYSSRQIDLRTFAIVHASPSARVDELNQDLMRQVGCAIENYIANKR